MTESSLDRTFERAEYHVRLNDRTLSLYIGKPPPSALHAWLLHHAGRSSAWLVTAHNPGGRRAPASINRARDAVLREWATGHATAWLDTVNVDPDGRWPDEPGLLLAGVEEGQARALAGRLGQAAIVAVPAGAPIALLWSIQVSE